MKPLRFKTWRIQKLQNLATEASKTSALISYLGPLKLLTIKSFFNLPVESFFDVLAWRLNNCFAHLLCTCGSTFQRSHVNCILESNEIYTETLNSPEYLRALAAVSSSRAPHFSVLDFTLNSINYESFTTLLNTIKSNIL
jgi:hypothetical protein